MEAATGPLRAGRDGVVLSIHVQPGARREGPAGLHDQRLRLRVAAPPEGGRANERVIALVAELFGVRRADVSLVGGLSSRRKDLALAGITLADARARLDAMLAADEEKRA